MQETHEMGTRGLLQSIGDLPQKLSTRTLLSICLLAELVSWLITRVVIAHFRWDTYQAESIRTLFRCGTALLYWWLLHDLIFSRVSTLGTLRSKLLVCGIFIFLLVPLSIQHAHFQTGFAIFFAASAIPVGIKEEFLFRGILQNLTMQKLGAAQAVLLTSMLATLWHIGVVEHSVWSFSQIFLANFFIGIVYIRTGNIWVAITLHTAYDMLFAIPDVLVRPNRSIALAGLFIAGLLASYSARSSLAAYSPR